MDDRESLIRLGRYLGVIGDDDLARQVAVSIARDNATAWMRSAVKILKKPLGRAAFEQTLSLIRSTDYEHISAPGSDPAERLARDLYDRLTGSNSSDKGIGHYDAGEGANSFTAGEGIVSFTAFHPYFRQFLRRIKRTLRGVLFSGGFKKEIVSLENPTAFEAVGELHHLPGRSIGENAHLPGNVCPTAAVARYTGILLDRYQGKCIDEGTCGKIREMLDRLSSYPGYFGRLERRRKAEAARPLTRAIERVRQHPGNEQDKDDLLVAITILLFSVYPSRQMVRYLATLRPGPGNRYLQHEYYALLALSYMRMGKPEQAASLAEKAFEIVPDADAKAYACLLLGCVQVQLGDFEKALAALDRGIELAGRRTRPIIVFYRGLLQYELGEARRALDSFRDSRTGCCDEGDTMTLCNNIGTCYMALGDLQSALKAFEEAENAFPYSGRLSVRQMRAVTSGNMGIVYLSMREPDLASEYFRKALRAAREAGNTKGVADQLANIGLAFKATKEYAAATSYFTSALNYSCSIDYMEGALYAREQLRQTLALDCRHDEVRSIERAVIRRHPRASGLLMPKRW